MMCRVFGGPDLSIGDQRVHFGHGGDHRDIAAEGAAGAELHGGVGCGERSADRGEVARRAPRGLRARGRVLYYAAAAAGK